MVSCEHNHTKQFIDYHESYLEGNEFTVKVDTWYCVDCLHVMQCSRRRIVYVVMEVDNTNLFGVHNLRDDAYAQSKLVGHPYKEAEIA